MRALVVVLLQCILILVYENEKKIHKNVFIKDRSVLAKFNDDRYKNAFVHILIKKARDYLKSGLKIPSKMIDVSKELCDENDKMKKFIENKFEITGNENDRVSRIQFDEMFGFFTKCNFSSSTILGDIKRCNLRYESKWRTIFQGKSVQGILVGIKLKPYEQTDEADFVQDDSKSHTSSLESLNFVDKGGLDYGLSSVENTLEKEVKELKEKFSLMEVEKNMYYQAFLDMQKQNQELLKELELLKNKKYESSSDEDSNSLSDISSDESSIKTSDIGFVDKDGLDFGLENTIMKPNKKLMS